MIGILSGLLWLASALIMIAVIGFAVAAVLTRFSEVVFCLFLGFIAMDHITLCETAWINFVLCSALIYGLTALVSSLLPGTKRAFKFLSACCTALAAYTMAFLLAMTIAQVFLYKVDVLSYFDDKFLLLVSFAAIPYAYMLSRECSYYPCSDIPIVALIDRMLSFAMYFCGLVPITQVSSVLNPTPVVLIILVVVAAGFCVVDKLTYCS